MINYQLTNLDDLNEVSNLFKILGQTPSTALLANPTLNDGITDQYGPKLGTVGCFTSITIIEKTQLCKL